MVSFEEDELLRKSIKRISEIELPDYVAEVSSRSIGDISEDGIADNFGGRDDIHDKKSITEGEVYRIRCAFSFPKPTPLISLMRFKIKSQILILAGIHSGEYKT